MSPDGLDAAGWAAIEAAGIATVVDLRNDDEVVGTIRRPVRIEVRRLPIEDQGDRDFMDTWGDRLGSPACYAEILRRWPDLVAAAMGAIADATGPVLFHCGAGRDRTGMISAMLEQIVGVDRDAILDDYASAVRAYNSWLQSNSAREKPRSQHELETHLDSARRELAAFLDDYDFHECLQRVGVTAAQVDRLRTRLLPG
jgi:protein-tyrosine phosphatase